MGAFIGRLTICPRADTLQSERAQQHEAGKAPCHARPLETLKCIRPMHVPKFNDRTSRWWLVAAVVANSVQWAIAATWPVTDLAPLHYTIYFGIDLTGPTWQVYSIPVFSLVIIILHGFISTFQASTLWSRLWTLVALVQVVLLTMSMMTLRFVVLR